jgi:hypothetical protein
MLTYFKGGFNQYEFRVEPIPSGSDYLAFRLQDMTTQINHGVLLNPGQWSYDTQESIVSFSVNLDTTTGNAPIGNEMRGTLTPGYSVSSSEEDTVIYNETVWRGSVQFFASQSEDKPAYVNQNDGFTSYDDSSNTYIIIK